jgi:hypothetical protein
VDGWRIGAVIGRVAPKSDAGFAGDAEGMERKTRVGYTWKDSFRNTAGELAEWLKAPVC